MASIFIPMEALTDLSDEERRNFGLWAYRQDKWEVMPFDDTNTVELDWVTMRQWWDQAGRPDPPPPRLDPE